MFGSKIHHRGLSGFFNDGWLADTFSCRLFQSPVSLAKTHKVFFSDKVVFARNLTGRLLEDHFSGKIGPIRIPSFCSKKPIQHALKRLEDKEIVEYANAEGVGKIKDLGMALFEIEDEVSKKTYYEQRIHSIRALRRAFSPYISPIDKVRVTLDENWKRGASLLDLGEGPLFVGLGRALRKEILPHEDKLERDVPSATSKISYISQSAFNCYLSMPKKGGELQLWNISLDTKTYNQLRGSSYGISRSYLPEPKITIRPTEGELVIFNSRYLHAVKCSEDLSTRVSLSGFILYQGLDKPLHFWS
jgi:hypothetical protein